MKKFFTLLVILLSICYPFIVYWGLQRFEAKWILPLVLIILSLRWLSKKQESERKLVIFSVLSLLVIIMLADQQTGLKFYPVVMNVGFFALFAGSLLTNESLVEKLARLKEPELPQSAIRYTRKVTLAWSVFFIINGTIACLTALFATDEIWVLYNGLIAYVLMGMLATGEWLIRLRVRKA
ncbi:hypothetical protein FX988_02327 [Paraglaciecola mesophila]|uniref:DNA gyrase subunit B n=1 Tax=Paraglaciecola mesophila TaxID=197222 RepID=A0A857JM51_9ALTE|nr:hypothetical protein [Paraglaciecola mesophila]QHJ12081.1 hypothetical protein FX988_02327 [Paraglaciecola mesophila]